MIDHRAIVTQIYEAFGTGDIPTILEHLADDVRWEEWEDSSAQAAGVAWLEPRTGRAGALEFFRMIGTWQVRDFRVHSVMAGGNQVAAEISILADLPNGKRLRDEEMHLWTFNDAGQVVHFRHYLDTAKHIALAES